MNPVIDLSTYINASSNRLLVIVDLQEKNYDELTMDPASGLDRSLKNCKFAIDHARNLGLPIAFMRQAAEAGSLGNSGQSAWIPGFEPKRSDMVFERLQPSCYTNQLFDDVVSEIGSFAIAGLIAEETCLATAIDASHRGHNVTFLSDASVSRSRHNADGNAVHHLAIQAIELFANPVATRDWLAAMSSRNLAPRTLAPRNLQEISRHRYE